MIDAYDRMRFEESRNELILLLQDESLQYCPVLVLGNKIDLPNAASEDEIRTYFNLNGMTTGKVLCFFSNCILFSNKRNYRRKHVN